MRKLIVGCGYVGLRVARSWMEDHHTVFAVTRSPENARSLAAMGIQPIIADVTDPHSLAPLSRLPGLETVLFAVGYDRGAGHAIHDVYVHGMEAVLEHLRRSHLKRFVYLSSTGVYGQDDGSWVDEESPCQPLREGGRACLETESRLREHPIGGVSVILRLAGIYGPERVPRSKELQAPSFRAATTGFLNLIHVDDVVQAILAAEDVEPVPALYVVSDGFPLPRIEYYRELCRFMGLNEITPEPPPGSSPAANRARGNKRIRSDRARRELGLKLRYPSFREGLSAVFAEG